MLTHTHTHTPPPPPPQLQPRRRASAERERERMEGAHTTMTCLVLPVSLSYITVTVDHLKDIITSTTIVLSETNVSLWFQNSILLVNLSHINRHFDLHQQIRKCQNVCSSVSISQWVSMCGFLFLWYTSHLSEYTLTRSYVFRQCLPGNVLSFHCGYNNAFFSQNIADV